LKRKATTQAEIDPLFDATLRHSNAIVLMLNRDKDKQKQIIEAVFEYQQFLLECIAMRNQQLPLLNDEKIQTIKEKMLSGL
jgi:hypothetical protein